MHLRGGGKLPDAGDSSLGEEVLYGDIWQKEDYLNWLYERLLAIREIMSETGSIYVHLDWHIGHYVKVLMDEVLARIILLMRLSGVTRVQPIKKIISQRNMTLCFYMLKQKIMFLMVIILGKV